MESLRKKHDILPELIGQRIVSIQTDDAGQSLTDVYFETDDFTFRAQATYENLTEIVAVTRNEKKNTDNSILVPLPLFNNVLYLLENGGWDDDTAPALRKLCNMPDVGKVYVKKSV